MLEASIDYSPFKGLSDNWVVVQNVAFRRLAEAVVVEAKANINPDRSGLHNRSGKLRDSIKLRRFFQLTPNGEAEAIIGAGNIRVPYARIHEQGGVIRAKNKPYLVFRIGSRWFKKKSVFIPARPYLSPAVTTEKANYDRYVSDAISEIVKHL